MATTTSSKPASSIRPGVPPTAPTPRRSTGRKWIGAVVLFAIVAGAVYLSIGATSRHRSRAVETYDVTRRSFAIVLNEKGEMEATKSVDVKCEVEGRSTIIWLIPEGTEVEEGDLLVKLASNEIDDKVRAEEIKVQNTKAAAEAADKELEITLDQHLSDIRKAELALRNAEIELNKYLEGDFLQQKMEQELALEIAKKMLVQAAGILEDSRQLKDKGFLTEREFQRDELTKYRAEVEVEKAKLALRIILDYTHPKDKEQKQSDVKEARKDLDRTLKKAKAEEDKQKATTAAKRAEYELTQERLNKLLEQQKKTEIHAPAPGLVVYETGRSRWNRVQVAEGSEVFERQTIIQLPDPSQMMVKVRIHEAKTSKIALGQRATVEAEGVPGVVFAGTVTKIAPLADSQNQWLNPDLKEYDTEITLDANEHDLKPGVTARAEILVREVKDVLAIPVQAVFSRGGGNFAFVGDDQSGAEPANIEVGYSSDDYVEVRSGLAEHDTVLLAASDALLAKLPSRREHGREEVGERREPPAKTTQKGRRPRPGGARKASKES